MTKFFFCSLLILVAPFNSQSQPSREYFRLLNEGTSEDRFTWLDEFINDKVNEPIDLGDFKDINDLYFDIQNTIDYQAIIRLGKVLSYTLNYSYYYDGKVYKRGDKFNQNVDGILRKPPDYMDEFEYFEITLPLAESYFAVNNIVRYIDMTREIDNRKYYGDEEMAVYNYDDAARGKIFSELGFYISAFRKRLLKIDNMDSLEKTHQEKVKRERSFHKGEIELAKSLQVETFRPYVNFLLTAFPDSEDLIAIKKEFFSDKK